MQVKSLKILGAPGVGKVIGERNLTKQEIKHEQ